MRSRFPGPVGWFGIGGRFPLIPDPLHVRDEGAIFYLATFCWGWEASFWGSQIWSDSRESIVFILCGGLGGGSDAVQEKLP